MNKKTKVILGASLVGLTAVVTPIVITSCSKTNAFDNFDTTNYKYQSIWNLNNKNSIYLENHNFGSNLDDIKLFDLQNNEIQFDKETSKIEDDKLLINFEDGSILPSEIKIENSTTKISSLLSKTDSKTFETYNLENDQKYFFDLVKDMSQNKIPSIGLMRDATLIVQQAFYISLVNYFNNPNSTDDKTFLFGKSILWSNARFNDQALIDSNVWSGNKNASTNEYGKFNLFQSDSVQNYKSEIIEEFNKILINTNNEYFDLFQDENDFMIQLINFNEDYFNFIFKHSNRVVLMSDGAYHVDNTIPKLVTLLNNHNPKPREEIIKTLNDFRNGKISKLTQSDVLDFMLLKNYEFANDNQLSNFDFVSFINYDGNLFNSLSLNNNKKFHDSAFSTSFVDYANYIDDENNKKAYLDLFSKLFVGNSLTKNDVFVNGVSEYDPNKKNAIFIGSSLFKPISGLVTENNYSRLELMPTVLKEVQDTFAQFLNKYNPKNYNIIFKMHPAFSNSDDPENLGAINYVNQITNGAIKNPIIVNPKIALESWIAADYNIYKNNPNNTEDSIIFRKSKDSSEVNSAKEWTTFFGLQATSTTIHTTRFFYQNVFKLDKNEVADLIPFSNFPIPKSFPVVERLTSDSTKNYYEDNVNRINSIFKAYCPSIQYSIASDINNLKEFDSILLNFNN